MRRDSGRKNIEQALASKEPARQRSVVATGDIGKTPGLDNPSAFNIVEQIGNHSERFEANLAPPDFERGVDRLRNKGPALRAGDPPAAAQATSPVLRWLLRRLPGGGRPRAADLRAPDASVMLPLSPPEGEKVRTSCCGRNKVSLQEPCLDRLRRRGAPCSPRTVCFGFCSALSGDRRPLERDRDARGHRISGLRRSRKVLRLAAPDRGAVLDSLRP